MTLIKMFICQTTHTRFIFQLYNQKSSLILEWLTNFQFSVEFAKRVNYFMNLAKMRKLSLTGTAFLI